MREPTSSQERYCLAIMDPEIQSELAAYRIGYPNSKMTDNAASSECWKLKQNPVIISRLEELKTQLVEFIGVDLKECVEIFRDAEAMARKKEIPAVMISAGKELGTISSLYPNQPQVQVNVQQNVNLTDLELARRVVGILQSGTADG